MRTDVGGPIVVVVDGSAVVDGVGVDDVVAPRRVDVVTPTLPGRRS